MELRGATRLLGTDVVTAFVALILLESTTALTVTPLATTIEPLSLPVFEVEVSFTPLITSLASDVGSIETRGSQLSVIEIAKRVGFGIGPVVGGLFFDYDVEALLWPTLVGVSLLLGAGVLLALEAKVPPAANGRNRVPSPAESD